MIRIYQPFKGWGGVYSRNFKKLLDQSNDL